MPELRDQGEVLSPSEHLIDRGELTGEAHRFAHPRGFVRQVAPCDRCRAGIC